jgi:hypothetical protein
MKRKKRAGKNHFDMYQLFGISVKEYFKRRIEVRNENVLPSDLMGNMGNVYIQGCA